MPVDQQRYSDLIARAAFDCSFYTGSIQDHSSAQRAMTFVGAPTWGRINGWPCLSQRAATDGSVSAAIPAVLDPSGTVCVEFLICCNISGFNYVWAQQPANGGMYIVFDATNTRLSVGLRDAGGVASRTFTTAVGTLRTGINNHCLFVSVGGGVSGLCWINGLPVAITPGGAGVPVPGGNATLNIMNQAIGATYRSSALLVRGWQSTMSNSDASCLAEQAKLMVGAWS